MATMVAGSTSPALIAAASVAVSCGPTVASRRTRAWRLVVTLSGDRGPARAEVRERLHPLSLDRGSISLQCAFETPLSRLGRQCDRPRWPPRPNPPPPLEGPRQSLNHFDREDARSLVSAAVRRDPLDRDPDHGTDRRSTSSCRPAKISPRQSASAASVF